MKAAARALFFDDSSLYEKRLFVKETEKSNDLFLLYIELQNEIVIKENSIVIMLEDRYQYWSKATRDYNWVA